MKEINPSIREMMNIGVTRYGPEILLRGQMLPQEREWAETTGPSKRYFECHMYLPISDYYS